MSSPEFEAIRAEPNRSSPWAVVAAHQTSVSEASYIPVDEMSAHTASLLTHIHPQITSRTQLKQTRSRSQHSIQQTLSTLGIAHISHNSNKVAIVGHYRLKSCP